ncbi:MAG: alpha/beta hydrolase [Azorhizobium sp. 32-67-21]|nr:MAG: alpha/beta hydrolase [Azorhizobium sp. 32-67-21]
MPDVPEITSTVITSTVIASTPTLHIACEISGPDDGKPVILLHGWPDDVRTWDRMLPLLHQAGFRAIVPSLRGFGGTRFRDPQTFRSGQLSALGQDLIDCLDALNIDRCAVIGHDWGARAAYIGACLAPERFSHCIALSVGWGTNDPDQPLSLQQAQNYWYHWLMAVPRGEAQIRNDRRAFTRHIWAIWTPDHPLSDAAFAETASSFDNPDWADIVLHSYRVRWGHAPVDPTYDAIEARLKADPTIRVPTLVLHGAADPCNSPATSDGKAHFFAGLYDRHLLDGIGHFPQREAPEETAARCLSFLTRELQP